MIRSAMVDAYHRPAVSLGAEIVKPMASEPWGMREFGRRTLDGHRIMVGQDLKSGDDANLIGLFRRRPR